MFVYFLVSGCATSPICVLPGQRRRVYLNSGSLPDVTLAQTFHPWSHHVLCPQYVLPGNYFGKVWHLKGCLLSGTKPMSGIHKQLQKLLLFQKAWSTGFPLPPDIPWVSQGVHAATLGTGDRNWSR